VVEEDVLSKDCKTAHLVQNLFLSSEKSEMGYVLGCLNRPNNTSSCTTAHAGWFHRTQLLR